MLLLHSSAGWVGVIVLALIGVELHNTNMNFETIIRASLVSNRHPHNDRFMNSVISRLVAKIRGENVLSTEERLQYQRLLRAALISWELEYLAFNNERIDWLPIGEYRTAMNNVPIIEE